MYEINRKLTWSSVKAGIVITVALFILLILVLFTGVLNELFEPKSIVYAKFKNVEGMRPGAVVWLYGLEKGHIRAINITKNGAYIKIAINRSAFRLLRTDASAKINTMGILGDKFVELNTGNSDGFVSENDTIKGINSTGFDDVISSSTATLKQLDSLTKNLTLLIQSVNKDDGSIGKLINDSMLYNNFNAAVKSIKQTTDHIRFARGSVNRLINDTVFYRNLNNATTGVNNLAVDIRNLIGTIDEGVSNGSLASALLTDSDLVDSLRQTISSYRTTAKTISVLIEDIKENPKKYFKIEVF
ncbi:MAG: MCE family protein [Chitinispirillaceae bacterium]|nr:MCE family protein [Chitinispirillaceae bacterium]